MVSCRWTDNCEPPQLLEALALALASVCQRHGGSRWAAISNHVKSCSGGVVTATRLASAVVHAALARSDDFPLIFLSC